MGATLPIALVQGGLYVSQKLANAAAIQQQAEAQSELQKQQNDWQHNENELDRSWQEQTWLQHFLSENEEYANRLALQQQNWQSQFDITNAYNSPSAQMARLRAAGVNPSAMLNNSGLASLGQSAATPSASSATAPNGVPFAGHGVSPASAPSFSGLSSQAAQFTSIAQMADSVSKLQQVGLNTERQKAILGAEVKKAINEADLTNQKSIMQRIENGVAENWLDKKSSAEYQKLVNESYAAFTSGDLNKANDLVMQAQERLISLQGEIMAAKFPEELANLQALRKVYQSEQEKNVAAAAASYASAEQSLSSAEFNRENAETVRQLRAGQVTQQILANAMQRIQNQMARRENMRDIKTNDMQIYAILQQCEASGYATNEQLERWIIASKDDNYYELKIILGEINAAVQAAATVAAPVAGASALPAKPPVTVNKQYIRLPKTP